MPLINGREDKIFAPVEAADGRSKLCSPRVSLRLAYTDTPILSNKVFLARNCAPSGYGHWQRGQVGRVGNRFFEPLPARIHLLARFQLLSFQKLPVSRKNVSRRVKAEGEEEKEEGGKKNNRDGYYLCDKYNRQVRKERVAI